MTYLTVRTKCVDYCLGWKDEEELRCIGVGTIILIKAAILCLNNVDVSISIRRPENKVDSFRSCFYAVAE